MEEDTPPARLEGESFIDWNKRYSEWENRKIARELASLDEQYPIDQRILDLEAQKARDKTKQLIKELRQQEQTTSPTLSIISLTHLLNREFPQEQWLIDKFLPAEGITLFVGEAGTFKSYMALVVIRHLITQEPFLGHFQVFKTCNILVIDKENKLRRLKRRVEALNLPQNDNVYFLEFPEKFNFDNRQDLNELILFISQKQIDVIILDSFIDMFEGDENSPTDTAKAFNNFRLLSPTASIIALHHDSKPTPRLIKTAGQKTRGSSNIIAQVDAQFYFQKGKDNNELLIEQGKSRDEEPIPKFIVKVVGGENGIADFIYDGEFKSEIKLVEEVSDWLYSYIKLTPHISKDILEEAGEPLGYSSRTIRNALTILKKKGLIDGLKKPGQGNTIFYFDIGQEEEIINQMDPRI